MLDGRAVHDSNISPAAEFNIFVDPEAAKIVFGCGAPIVMVGLDVTNKAQLSFADIDEMESWKGRVSRVVAPLLRFFANTNKEVFGFTGAPVHDALAVAHLVRPEVITTKRMNVEIETAGELHPGSHGGGRVRDLRQEAERGRRAGGESAPVQGDDLQRHPSDAAAEGSRGAAPSARLRYLTTRTFRISSIPGATILMK